jgi:hypothetical protein
MMRQITTAAFPKSWQARNTERRNATEPLSHDSRQSWKRLMLRLDDPAGERLDELATYFDELHAEVIRQLIIQVRVDDFPPSWHLAYGANDIEFAITGWGASKRAKPGHVGGQVLLQLVWCFPLI